MYNPFSLNSHITEAERLSNGDWYFKLFDNQNTNNFKRLSDNDRLNFVLSNPALLKVFKLNCDLFSLAEVTAIRNNKVLPVSGLDGLKVMKVIEAAIKSNEERKVIEL